LGDWVITYEFELRYAVKDHATVLESLHRLKARFKTKVIQRDHYFTPPPIRTIEKGSILRIREESRDGETRIVLSCKTPNILNEGVETREETEIEVLADVQAITKLIENLGAKPLVPVTKERTEYTLTFGRTHFTVTLDQVDTLGSFVEIELVSSKKEDVEHLIVLGDNLAAKLGLDLSKKIVLGYHELMLGKR
jgi:adenylate cyclase class 2